MLKSPTVTTLKYLEQIDDNILCNSEIHNTNEFGQEYMYSCFGGIYMQQTSILSEPSEILQHTTSILLGLRGNKTVSDLKAEFINLAQSPSHL